MEQQTRDDCEFQLKNRSCLISNAYLKYVYVYKKNYNNKLILHSINNLFNIIKQYEYIFRKRRLKKMRISYYIFIFRAN